jgi:uncharacterized hydrophobic protein (TIGR00271 family)
VFALRAYGDPATMAGVSEGLHGIPGVRHLDLSAGGTATAMVTADVGTDAADAVLATLRRLGVPPEDVVLTRLERITDAPEEAGPVALVWADVLGQARARARAPGRYLLLMAAAGVVAAFAVLNRSPVLIVGAMAISPDLLPITAACTGIVLLRPRLVRRALASLVLGLAVVGLTSLVVTALLDLFDSLPPGFALGDIPASQTHVGASTIAVALAAGVAGILAVETRASAAVGVAISVTTIPAVAYLGVGLGIGEPGKALSALAVLAANVAMMLIGGTATLAGQRALAGWSAARPRLPRRG